MGYEELIPIAERSIGRSGRDLFLSNKSLTIVMAPFEKYSAFPAAVDALYKNITTPFNLIVVEGNAPEEIRLALENRQHKHGNMSIIYTNHCPSLAKAFNLALMHIKTPYALFMDNEIRIPKGSIDNLMEVAKECHAPVICPQNSMMERNIRSSNGNGRLTLRKVKTFGIRPCFLMSQEAFSVGKIFGEFSSPYSFGVDLIYRLRSKNLAVHMEESFKVETALSGQAATLDMPIFRMQWNRNHISNSLQVLERNWGIQLVEDSSYDRWIESKMEQAEKTPAMDALLNRVLSAVKYGGLKRVQEAVIQFRPLGNFSKQAELSKMNASR